jgi:hypothetical protein
VASIGHVVVSPPASTVVTVPALPVTLVWSPVLVPLDVPECVPDRLEPVTVPLAATLDGVIAPSANVIAGVVVAVATLPDTPLAVVTETLVTDPLPPGLYVIEPTTHLSQQ